MPRARSFICAQAIAGAVWLAASGVAGAADRPIDIERSALTIFVYKTGLFSAFADDHIIQAPIAQGRISDGESLMTELTVRAAALRVLDPSLSAAKRADVSARMLGSEVLDIATHPEIRFASTTITADGENRWRVEGTLTLHGISRPMTTIVQRRDGHYRGTVALRQRDFGIQPISIVGGTVKVKDEIRIEFDIVAR